MIFKVCRHWQWLRFLSLIISNEMGGCIAKAVLPSPSPTPHLFSPRCLRQASPSSGSRPVLCSKLLLYTFIKSTLRDRNSGDSTLNALFKSKVAWGVCFFLLFFWIPPLYSLNPLTFPGDHFDYTVHISHNT